MKWTAATRKNLHAFVQQNKNDPAAARVVASPADAWRDVHAFGNQGNVTFLGDEVHAPAVAKLQRELASANAPTFDPELELHRAAWVLSRVPLERTWLAWDDWAPERALTSFWFATGGVARTLEVLLSNGSFWLDTVRTWQAEGDRITVTFLSAPKPGGESRPYSLASTYRPTSWAVWSTLRCIVDRLPADDFGKASADARRALETLDEAATWGRASIAFAFARGPEFGAVAKAMAEKAAGGTTVIAGDAQLVLALPDVESVVAYASKMPISGDIAFDLVERHGPAASAVLRLEMKRLEERAMPVAMRKRLLKPFESALKVLGEK